MILILKFKSTQKHVFDQIGNVFFFNVHSARAGRQNDIAARMEERFRDSNAAKHGRNSLN